VALQAYRAYGDYLVELMRVPFMPQDEVLGLIDPIDIDEIRRFRDATPGGLILTVGHVGNNDLIGAAIAHHGLPLSVVADDSSFPELFDYLRGQREQWSATLIPWRNLRGIFAVLRRRELLGLLVDWGYRSDGIPVRLFDAWTTLPAGPATLAAKTGSRILPILTSRLPGGRMHVTWAQPITVASSDPAELQRATQAIADALAEAIRPAPEQWYSFKPIWPATAEEAADLERRALAMQAGRPDPGPGRGLPRDPADAAEAPRSDVGGADAVEATS
jgi:KDO2-lipid IV(A) lauroyltransferase